jgi:hypothetical protein
MLYYIICIIIIFKRYFEDISRILVQQCVLKMYLISILNDYYRDIIRYITYIK